MLEIQKFLQQVGDVEVGNMMLQTQLGIVVTKHYYNGEYLYHYTYPDINDKKHKIVEECNLLVLDADGKIVSKSFDRIYDVHDPIGYDYTTFVDARAELQEQGLLVVINNYKNKLLLVTKKGVNGKEYVDTNRPLDSAMSLFLYSKFKSAQPLSKFIEGLSYVCLFILPKEETPYKYPELLLLTIIDKSTGKELSNEFVKAYAEGNALSRPLNTPVLGANYLLESSANNLTITNGIILVDRTGKRVVARNTKKLKVIVKDINDNVTLEKFASAVLNKKHRRVMLNFPVCKDMLDLLHKTVMTAKLKLESQWESLDGLPVEEFTKRVENNPLRALLQRRRLHKIYSFANIEEYLAPQQLIKLAASYFSKEYEKTYYTLVNEVTK